MGWCETVIRKRVGTNIKSRVSLRRFYPWKQFPSSKLLSQKARATPRSSLFNEPVKPIVDRSRLRGAWKVANGLPMVVVFQSSLSVVVVASPTSTSSSSTSKGEARPPSCAMAHERKARKSHNAFFIFVPNNRFERSAPTKM